MCYNICPRYPALSLHAHVLHSMQTHTKNLLSTRTQALGDVDMCGNQITLIGIGPLAAGIAASSSLAAVALDNNDAREEGGQKLLEAVQKNKGIVQVHKWKRRVCLHVWVGACVCFVYSWAWFECGDVQCLYGMGTL